MHVTDAIFATLSLLALLGSALIFGYLVSTEKSAPRFSDSIKNLESNHTPDELVSVIVPARNEGKVITKCIASILAQSYSRLEIIVVDDSSSDDTKDVVKALAKNDNRVKLVSAGEKPKGWVGKTWPCWRGYENSSGSYLLFVDADSTLSRSVIESSLKYAMEKKIDMLSLSPRAEMQGVSARAVLPLISGAINLLYPMQKVNDKKSERAYVFGTYVLVKRSVYEETRGHEEVRGELVEDAAMASVTKEAGYSLRIERGNKLLTTLWESDSKSIYQGLERIISRSIRSYGLVSILNAVLLFFMTLFPILYVFSYALLLSPGDVAFAGFVACILNIVVFLLLAEFETVGINGRIGLGAFLYPVGSVFFIVAIVSASIKVTRGKELNWKDSGYIQETDSKGK